MSHPPYIRDSGPKHEGSAATSRYPMSRLAPVHELVDAAREIQGADAVIGATTNAKLETIVTQIRALQDQARAVLTTARESALLHRAGCGFAKRVGATYHLYHRHDGDAYFSMLSPADWRGAPPHDFEGSYRLEPDMSWSRVDRLDAPSPQERFSVTALVAGLPTGSLEP